MEIEIPNIANSLLDKKNTQSKWLRQDLYNE